LTFTAAIALFAGCATSGYESGNKTASNIQKAAAKIDELTTRVDATLASLNDLVGSPQPDLRPQYKAFNSNLKSLDSTAKEITKKRMAMGDEGKQFLAKWDAEIAQINNEDIKTRSQNRKTEVNEKLQAIKRSYAEAEVAFRPFMGDLNDVQKFLSVDLTTGGLNSIKDIVTKATQHAVPLKQTLAKLSSDFKALGVSMSSVAPDSKPAPRSSSAPSP
jgi:SMC interacting uncharacterized protein involved in chromosome segregation